MYMMFIILSESIWVNFRVQVSVAVSIFDTVAITHLPQEMDQVSVYRFAIRSHFLLGSFHDWIVRDPVEGTESRLSVLSG